MTKRNDKYNSFKILLIRLSEHSENRTKLLLNVNPKPLAFTHMEVDVQTRFEGSHNEHFRGVVCTELFSWSSRMSTSSHYRFSSCKQHFCAEIPVFRALELVWLQRHR